MERIVKTTYKKKGQFGLNQIFPTVLTIVLVGIVLGIGLYVVGTFSEQIMIQNQSSNSSDVAIELINSMGEFFPVIIIIVLAATILGITFAAFSRGDSRLYYSGESELDEEIDEYDEDYEEEPIDDISDEEETEELESEQEEDSKTEVINKDDDDRVIKKTW